jgi:hypothetical protein
MKTIIHARNTEALKNGSFVAQRIGKKSSSFAHYMNGDFIGWLNALPAPLTQACQTWTLKDARKIMPRGI